MLHQSLLVRNDYNKKSTMIGLTLFLWTQNWNIYSFSKEKHKALLNVYSVVFWLFWYSFKECCYVKLTKELKTIQNSICYLLYPSDSIGGILSWKFEGYSCAIACFVIAGQLMFYWDLTQVFCPDYTRH